MLAVKFKWWGGRVEEQDQRKRSRTSRRKVESQDGKERGKPYQRTLAF
jgi:hypothetical protein